MKILRVRFFNLNSLQGEHAVDFAASPLSDAGLFAITGPTGAGKTTILDAITLALYGQVPRHDGSGPEQVMSHGTGESWAEVEFQVSGQLYRSKWSQYRARKKPEGNLQDAKMELSQQPAPDAAGAVSAEWPLLESYKSKVPAKVAELSGLEYRQFLRSVLLAQGEFTKFLKSSPGERAQLLEKITDTKKYSDISRAAFERSKHESQQVENLRLGLAGVTLLSEQEVGALEAEVADLHAQLGTLQAEQQRLHEAQVWLRQLDDLTARQQRGQQRLLVLAAEAEVLQPLRRRVAGHERALPFQTPWALLQQADRQISLLQQPARPATRLPRPATRPRPPAGSRNLSCGKRRNSTAAFSKARSSCSKSVGNTKSATSTVSARRPTWNRPPARPLRYNNSGRSSTTGSSRTHALPRWVKPCPT
jgi:exonuclease SbcC